MITSSPVTINGRSHLLHCHTQTLSSANLLAWLESNPLFPKFFWKENAAVAAAGAAASWTECPTVDEDPQGELRLYGGMGFANEKHQEKCWEECWSSFPPRFFFLPLYELRKRDHCFELKANALDSTPAKLPELSVSLTPYRKTAPLTRTEHPNYADWKRLVEKALAAKELSKVVLARKTSLQFPERLSPLALLEALIERANAKTYFAFQPSSEAAFIGATPEKLFERRGTALTADVIAGTFLNQQDAKEAKLQREFLYVKESVRATLAPLSVALACAEEEGIIPAYQLLHLYNCFNATLRPEVTDAELLQALHPTPAIGGSPKAIACQFIRENEPFERGWYSAPIGWISHYQAEFAVAIRSALVRGEMLDLFAGAGLVEGSDPLQEWEELEQKIGLFL